MPSTTRNIIIFVGIAAIFTSIYFFYFKKSTPKDNLVVSQNNSLAVDTNNASTANANISAERQNLLSKLSNLKDVHLDTGIFSDKAFLGLRDSTIPLEPDQSEGRPNPFAKFGSDSVESAVNNSASILSPLIQTAPTTPTTSTTPNTSTMPVLPTNTSPRTQ